MGVDLDVADARVEGILELLGCVYRCNASRRIAGNTQWWCYGGWNLGSILDLAWGRLHKCLHKRQTSCRLAVRPSGQQQVLTSPECAP